MARSIVPRHDNTARVPKTSPQKLKKAARGAQVSKSAKIPKRKRTTRAKRAGLTFPVGRVDSKFRKSAVGVNRRIGATAAVFLTAALEYMCSELLELSGIAAHQNKKKKITPRFLMLAVRGDEELDQLFAKTIIAQAGVQPKPIHESLLPKNARK